MDYNAKVCIYWIFYCIYVEYYIIVGGKSVEKSSPENKKQGKI